MELIGFILAVFLCFYLPGRLIYVSCIARQNDIVSHGFSLFLGFLVFAWASVLLAFLQLRFLFYPLILWFLILAVRKRKYLFSVTLDRRSLWTLGVCAVCVMVFGGLAVTTGWITPNGLVVHGAWASDGLWHVALVNELAHTFPPEHPGLAGIRLTGYHFFYDLILSEFNRLWGLSSIHLVFHLFPPLVALMWVVGVYQVAEEWFRNRIASLLSVILSIFGGSFAFIVPVIFRRPVSLDDGLGITQPISALVNPQFAISMVLVLYCLYFFTMYVKSRKPVWLVLLVLATGISVGMKVYAGMILLGALLAVGVIDVIVSRRIHVVLSGGLAAAIAWLIFKPFNSSYGFLLYQPFWPPHRVMQSTLDFTKWEITRQTYEQLGDVIGLTVLEIKALFIFIFGNLGTRVLGVPFLFLAAWRTKDIHMRLAFTYFFLMIGVGSITPMFFIQPTGGPFNMIQMYWYVMVLLAFPTAYVLAKILRWLAHKNLVASIIFGLLFFAITLPTAWEKTYGYFFSPPLYIPADYVAVFQALAKEGTYSDIALELPNTTSTQSAELNSWFSWISDPYFPALSNKRAYIQDETVTFAYEDKGRRLSNLALVLAAGGVCDAPREQNLCQKALSRARDVLDREHIRYIMTPSVKPWVRDIPGVKQFYTNANYELYEVLPL